MLHLCRRFFASRNEILTILCCSAAATRKYNFLRTTETSTRADLRYPERTKADERNSYNTRSNKVRVMKTPGGKLRYLHIKKRGSPVKCGDCGIKLPGVSTTIPNSVDLRR